MVGVNHEATPPDPHLSPIAHHFVTTEATLLVGVLVVFYLSIMLLLFGTTLPCPFSNSTQPEIKPRLRSRKRLRSIRNVSSQTVRIETETPPQPQPQDLEVVLNGTKTNKIVTKAVQPTPVTVVPECCQRAINETNNLQRLKNQELRKSIQKPLNFSVITQSQIVQPESEDRIDQYELQNLLPKPAG